MAAAVALAGAVVAAPAASAAEQPFAVTSPQNGATVATTTPIFEGVGTTGNTVTLTYSGQQLDSYTAGVTTVDEAGNWSTPTTFDKANPGETSTRVLVRETDSAGAETGAFFITVTFPQAPVPAAVFTLESPVDGETRDDFLNIVHYVGTGNAGNTITVRYFDGRGGLAVAGTGEVDRSGRFDVFTNFGQLPPGQDFANTFTVQTTPAGDRVSNEIGRTIFFADAPVEATPFTVTSPAQGERVDSLTPEFRGTGTPGDTVTLNYGGQQLGTYLAGQATVTDDGTWVVPQTDFSRANFGETDIRVVAAAKDAAGTERPGARFVDIVLPSAPAQQVPFTLTTPTEGETIESPREGVAFVGTGAPGNTIVVEYFNGRGGLSEAGTAIVGADGSFEVRALFDGLPADQLFANTFTQQENANGDRVAREIGRTIFFAEAPVVTPLDAPTLDQPVVNGTNVTFTGTGLAGATVSVEVAAAPTSDAAQVAALAAAPVTLTAVVAADGTWSVASAIEPGDYVARASQFTGDGANRSASTADRAFSVEPVVTPPAGPGDGPTGAGPGTDNGSSPTATNHTRGLAATGGTEPIGALAAGLLLLIAGVGAVLTRRLRTAQD